MKKVVALSTDKASSPINLYGATKLSADKLFVSGNHYAAAVRHPVLRRALRQRHGQPRLGHPVLPQAAPRPGESLPITDLRMTRFLITLPQAVQFVVDSFDLMHGGELFVPRIPSMKIIDLAAGRSRPARRCTTSGIRPGEKLHEEMISPDEGRRALRLGDRYVVQPDLGSWGYEPAGRRRARSPTASSTASDSNDQWFTRERDRRDRRVGI